MLSLYHPRSHPPGLVHKHSLILLINRVLCVFQRRGILCPLFLKVVNSIAALETGNLRTHPGRFVPLELPSPESLFL